MIKEIRLQKFLSEQGICSRRKAEEWITAREILINGEVATLGDKVTGEELILIRGKKLEIKTNLKRVVLAFHKPKNVEVTLQKTEGAKTIADYDFGVGRVFPIGRLDKDSRGLLLLTNDGDLANKLMHPRYQKSKTYQVRVHQSFDKLFINRMRTGVMFSPGKKSSPCQVKSISEQVFEITLKEGANRQIRRMCSSLGYEVIDLFRTHFGPVALGNLKADKWIDVTEFFSDGA